MRSAKLHNALRDFRPVSKCGCVVTAANQLPKLRVRVRFPSVAPPAFAGIDSFFLAAALRAPQHGSLAQSAEPPAHNGKVAGSFPAGSTTGEAGTTFDLRGAKAPQHPPLAQSAEHLPFKQGVRGSKPRWGTNARRAG